MDALSAAKSRIDRALNEIESKLQDLQLRAAATTRLPDDDLFAPLPSSAADIARIAELEAAGQEAAHALAAAAKSVREVLEQQADSAVTDTSTESGVESR